MIAASLDQYADHTQYPDRHDSPRVKAWRCDLTALSKLYNIYFLACNDAIYVYRPSFPDQNLPNEPDLILHPPISTQIDSEGGIDAQDPHSINRIVIDFLGHEEILLAACDDGDVVGYRVKEIQRTLAERVLSLDVDSDVALEDTPRVFLHQNVGASAWGLAVHREARIIAISANTHQITVLAYALVQSDDFPKHSSTSNSRNSDDPVLQKPGLPFFRRREHTFTLMANTNIPSVSFNNNGDDPSGRWLFSSSIDGKTIIWDLHHPGQLTRVIQVGWCASTESPTQAPGPGPGQCACHDRGNVAHGAWGAVLLDARSAYEIDSIEQLSLGSHRIAPCFRDITESKEGFHVKSMNARIHGLPDEWDSSSDEVEGSSNMAMSISEEEAEDDDAESSAHLQLVNVSSPGDDMIYNNYHPQPEEALIADSTEVAEESPSTGLFTDTQLLSLFIPDIDSIPVATELHNPGQLQSQQQLAPLSQTNTIFFEIDEVRYNFPST